MKEINIKGIPEDLRIKDLKRFEKDFPKIQGLSYDFKKNTLKLKKNEFFAEELVKSLNKTRRNKK